jgi:hypothetical protein
MNNVDIIMRIRRYTFVEEDGFRWVCGTYHWGDIIDNITTSFTLVKYGSAY